VAVGTNRGTRRRRPGAPLQLPRRPLPLRVGGDHREHGERDLDHDRQRNATPPRHGDLPLPQAPAEEREAGERSRRTTWSSRPMLLCLGARASCRRSARSRRSPAGPENFEGRVGWGPDPRRAPARILAKPRVAATRSTQLRPGASLEADPAQAPVPRPSAHDGHPAAQGGRPARDGAEDPAPLGPDHHGRGLRPPRPRRHARGH
jgi:hypothetical protein